MGTSRQSTNKLQDNGSDPCNLPSSVNQLPLWAERVRGLPNTFARSALFSVGKGARRQLKNETIATLQDTQIRYTGTQLRQDDEDVFLQLIHLARGRPVVDFVEFSAYGMLKELAWWHSSRSYTRLRDCIERLKANALKITFNIDGRTVTFAGSLIRKFVRSEEPGSRETWKVWFEREVIVLFGQMSYSEIEWSQRCQLDGEIAKWLLGFFVTWPENEPVEVKALRTLCGSQCNSLTAFRQMLKLALAELQRVGFLHDSKMDKDFVWITRDPEQMINRTRRSRRLLNNLEDQEELLMS